MKKDRVTIIIVLILMLMSISTTMTAQYVIPNFVEPEYVTISSSQGINVRSIEASYDGSYLVTLSNSNRGNQGEITSYSFEWYLSYKGKRVSDYFQETIRCGQSSSRTVYCWPGEVPLGNERYVTVQLGREPARRDRRDDDY